MIYLVDFIGVHCGMHYYLEAFKQILESIDGVKVGIVSNFTDSDEAPVLLNHYKGNKFNKVFLALRNLHRLDRFIKNHKDDKFIYLTYGNILDTYFLRIATKTPHLCIDIHEALAQNEASNAKLKATFANIYSGKIKQVISHSSRTDDYLREFGYKGDSFHVPHFRYVFPRDYNANSIPEEMKNAIAKDKVNILFFGNITKEKGIDILLEAVNNLSEEDADKINVIVAGKDIDGVYKNVTLKRDRSVHFFTRHISDDELRFLYDNVDFLALPYRTTSQSGILEMAFYFKKPIIATNIPYFRKMLTEFPSFGILNEKETDNFSYAIRAALRKEPSSFFNEEEYSLYQNRKEVEEFKSKFREWLISD